MSYTYMAILYRQVGTKETMYILAYIAIKKKNTYGITSDRFIYALTFIIVK